MAIGLMDTAPVSRRVSRNVPPGYRLMLFVGFLTFLNAAILKRVMPWRWRVFGGSGTEYASIFEEARTRTYSTVPHAFMK